MSRLSFWYGLSFDESMNMPMASLEAYLDRLPARMAEWKMVMADPISLPHMLKQDQRQTLQRWESELRAMLPARKPVPAKLKMMGVGVRFERTDDRGRMTEDRGRRMDA